MKAVAREMHRRGQASSICIDQLPLILNGEVQYLMMYGTPGSGKSNTINKLLKQIRARGDMAIIYDKGCSLIKKHFNERDDTLLNALDRRCAYWDMFREFESIPDFDSAASTLIPMGTKEDPLLAEFRPYHFFCGVISSEKERYPLLQRVVAHAACH